MVCRAAVKIYDKRQDKEVIIPCHRHCDAFQILKEFGYKHIVDYEEIAQGFLDEYDNFMSRTESWLEAERCGQISAHAVEFVTSRRLYSEDLW